MSLSSLFSYSFYSILFIYFEHLSFCNSSHHLFKFTLVFVDQESLKLTLVRLLNSIDPKHMIAKLVRDTVEVLDKLQLFLATQLAESYLNFKKMVFQIFADEFRFIFGWHQAILEGAWFFCHWDPELLDSRATVWAVLLTICSSLTCLIASLFICFSFYFGYCRWYSLYILFSNR